MSVFCNVVIAYRLANDTPPSLLSDNHPIPDRVSIYYQYIVKAYITTILTVVVTAHRAVLCIDILFRENNRYINSNALLDGHSGEGSITVGTICRSNSFWAITVR